MQFSEYRILLHKYIQIQLTYVAPDADNVLELVRRKLTQRLLVQTKRIQLPAKDHCQHPYSLPHWMDLPLHEHRLYHHGDDDSSAHYHVNVGRMQLSQPNLLYLEIHVGNSQILAYISWCHPMIAY